MYEIMKNKMVWFSKLTCATVSRTAGDGEALAAMIWLTHASDCAAATSARAQFRLCLAIVLLPLPLSRSKV